MQRERPQAVAVDMTPLTGPVSQIRPIELRQARRTAEEPLFNSLIEHVHVTWDSEHGGRASEVCGCGRRTIRCLSGVEVRHYAIWVTSRWLHRLECGETRRRNINSDRLQYAVSGSAAVGPDSHLASHILGASGAYVVRGLGNRCTAIRFTLPRPSSIRAVFAGTCYRAANWRKLLGMTTGRGKDSTSKRPNRSLKRGARPIRWLGTSAVLTQL